MEKKINLSISEGNPFFAHEASINYSPMQFIFDFRCITPRIDPRANEAPIIHMQHNIVMLDPYNAKKIQEMLGKMISKYEKDFGKIEKSNAAKIMDKKRKKTNKKIGEGKSTPNYFG